MDTPESASLTSSRDGSSSEKENKETSLLSKPPPPKPAKPRNINLSTYSPPKPREELIRASVRNLGKNKRVAALKERYDPKDNFQRWKSDENLCIFRDRRNSQKRVQIPSFVAEESSDDELDDFPRAGKSVTLKPTPLETSSTASPEKKKFRDHMTVGVNVRDRIRSFEQRVSSLDLSTCLSGNHSLGGGVSPRVKSPAASTPARHTIFFENSDAIYEEIGRFASPVKSPPKKMSSPLDHIYAVAGFELRDDGSSCAPAQENEYASVANVTAESSNNLFLIGRTSARSNASEILPNLPYSDSVITGSPADYMVSEIRSRISEAFSVYRKLSAVNQQGSDADTDDDGSRSNLSGDLADRISRAEDISSRTAGTLLRSVHAQRLRHDQLFTGCAVIRLFPRNVRTEVAFVHPPSFSELQFSHALPYFCFPDADIIVEKRQRLDRYIEDCDQFSFVITDHFGDRLYGYCRRVANPVCDSFPTCKSHASSGGNYESCEAAAVAEAYVIVSPVESEQLFNQILQVATDKRRVSLVEAETFLTAVYSRPLPFAGGWFDLQTTDSSGRLVTERFERPAHWRMQHVPYSWLFTFPGSQISLILFAALLHEHRVALVSNNPKRLSSVAQALAGLLYPLRWQHTFVPVLPRSMLSIICSPTPFIIGILEKDMKIVEEELASELDNDVIIVHLDRGEFLRRQADDKIRFPRKLSRALRKSLDSYRLLVHRSPRFCTTAFSTKEIMETVVIETCLRFFSVLIGHYADHVTVGPDGKRQFNRDAFCSAPRSKGLRSLLRILTRTGNFHVFINDVLEGQAYEANKLTVSTVLSNFDRAVRQFRDDCELNERKSVLTDLKSKMKKIFTGGRHDQKQHSRNNSGSLSGSYPTRATLKTRATFETNVSNS